MIYQGLPVEIVNAGLRLLRLADRSLGKREPFYKFDFQGWKLLILPPKPRVLSGENSPQNGQKGPKSGENSPGNSQKMGRIPQ